MAEIDRVGNTRKDFLKRLVVAMIFLYERGAF
jgi:hypothetical protein